MAAIVGAFCVAVFVSRKAFSSERCDSEDVWGALRCPHSRNTATAAIRPANYASSMQMSCRERDKKTERGSLRQRHNGVCEGSMCVLSDWDCCLIAMFTQRLHSMSLAHSVVSFVLSHHSTAPWGHYCSTGMSGENWHILCGDPDTLHGVVFLCTFKQPWGQLIFDQSTSQGLLFLLMVWLASSHMSLCNWWDR